MKQIEELADSLRQLLSLETLTVKTEEFDDLNYKKIRLSCSDYYLYIPAEVSYYTAYFIKRILEMVLNEYLKNIEKENYLAHFTVLVEELLETYRSYPSADYTGLDGFQFLNELMNYAIIKNDAVLFNKNIDKYTLDTSLLKLNTQDEFCMFVKNGEVFAAKTQHFKAVLSCDTEIEDIIKTALKVRLAFLNKLYENEMYLQELKNINTQLEQTVKSRTLEIENKNRLLEEEKIKLNHANTKLTDLNAYLDSLSRIDPLTKLSNRRDLQEKFEHEIKKSKRKPASFSLIVGDVDFYKTINDTYGHECGDQVLIRIADIFRGNLRSEDLIARYGGDEFVIFLPETDYDYAYMIIERLRRMLENEVFEYNGNKIHITMSFGLFNFSGEFGFTQCIRCADEALYKAKSGGRNQVVSIKN